MLWKIGFVFVLVLLLLIYDVGRGKPEIFSHPEIQAFRVRMLATVERVRLDLETASRPELQAARSRLRDAAQSIRSDLREMLPVRRATLSGIDEADGQSR